MRQIYYLTVNSQKSAPKPQSAILPEKLAIILCGLLVAAFAIPLLVVIHALSGLFWGIITVVKLLSGKGLFDEEGEL